MSRAIISWAQFETPISVNYQFSQVDDAGAGDSHDVQVSGQFLEVATGKMLNARFSTTSYTDTWIYLSTDGVTFTPTYNNPPWSLDARGKLVNFRMIQAAFAHFDGTGYPEPFDPQQNTDDFCAALPDYRAKGVLAMTVGMQGGNPNYGDRGADHDIGAFNADGSLRVGNGTYTDPEAGTWMARTNQIIEAMRDEGMVCILNLFYHAQEQKLTDNDAVRAAVDNVVDWLVANDYRNVIIDIANEYDISGTAPAGFQRTVLSNNGSGAITGDSDEIGALVIRIRERFENHHKVSWRPPTSTSVFAAPWSFEFNGNLRAEADLALVHGNAVDDWDGDDTEAELLALRSSIDGDTNPNIPIVMNEDDNEQSSANDSANDTNLANELHALQDCMAADESWGTMLKSIHQYYRGKWWTWRVGIAGVPEGSRTREDHTADVLNGIEAALSSGELGYSQNDDAGASDLIATQSTYVRSTTDDAGARDRHTLQGNRRAIISWAKLDLPQGAGVPHTADQIDDAGATDISTSSVSLVAGALDGAGASDTSSAASQQLRGEPDDAGASDQATQAHDAQRPIADAAGVDLVGQIVQHVRSQVDQSVASDQFQAVNEGALNRVRIDHAGASDDEQVQIESVRDLIDLAGEDHVAVSHEANPSQLDDAGATDQSSYTIEGVAQYDQADDAGSIDLTTWLLVSRRTQEDDGGAVDERVVGVTSQRDVVDDAGATDFGGGSDPIIVRTVLVTAGRRVEVSTSTRKVLTTTRG